MRRADGLADPMAKWSPAPDWSHAELVRKSWRARPVIGLTLTLIGGKLDRALAALAPSAESVGLSQVAAAMPYALRIGRDKALLVALGERLEQAGWREEGWTASDATDAQVVFEIEGDAVQEILSEAVASDLNLGSPSAAVLFAGVPVLLSRSPGSAVRLHVETSLGAYVWRWLEKRGE